ncbi:family 10 glycosylhydrolase [Acaryochloris sp. IP29b_bin.148]|uniref:family 10 glycosylhydrolase n=1 Tax=Acaryochloris sp. IP29b_bin.148 TaxID=2969218 RepID=UPI002620F961|nr:family 10 glycosylhydrolase [Acaryochloris sp. IP29b_bin.148]
MTKKRKEPKGCGCGSIPFSVILLVLGVGGWWFSQAENRKLGRYLPPDYKITIPILNQPITLNPSQPSPSPTTSIPIKTAPQLPPPKVVPPDVIKVEEPKAVKFPQAWTQKTMRGIYLSRYQVTNNATEKTIRDRVRYYKAQGFNTILHGVWGNACTMYKSDVMAKTLGFPSCPNLFRDQWLDWLIDEAHQQNMQVHAYFEKGIKIDKNSPVYERAVAEKWLVPGVDRTYSGIEHYVLDVDNPTVAKLFKDIVAEFVQKYPTVDAVQWDDYLGYHAELPGKVDRTASLTKFSQQMIEEMKKVNSKVSFDLCHHNPYWSKRYFAADWKNWDVDRVFIQAYNEANFAKELEYAQAQVGIAITDNQLHRLQGLVEDPDIKGILVFPLSGKPEETAVKVKNLVLQTE